MVTNPFDAFPESGDWAGHASYSAGGVDYPTPYGFEIHAPAAGTLHTSGQPGSGFEFKCGWVGSAGRRSILMLDTPMQRSEAALSSPPEGAGDMVAIVFQHQSQFGADGKHYAQGEGGLGWTGASANGQDWGGDVHVHWHGLTADGHRVRVESFTTGSTPNPEEEDMKAQYFVATSDSPSGLVKANSVWVRPAPGLPLSPLTAGQAHDWFAMDGLDFNAPNVFGKPGEWYDAAFAEDAQMAELYARVHPTSGGASIDEAAIVAIVEKAIQGNYQVVKQ